MTTRSVICVTTRSIQRATLFLPPALPPLLLTRTSRHIPCSKTICRPRTSYFLYGLAMSSSFWSRATLYPTSSLPRTSDFISTNNWMTRWIGRCALYLEARLVYWRWRERREHDPSYRCRCVSHFHVSSVCKTKLCAHHRRCRQCWQRGQAILICGRCLRDRLPRCQKL